MRAALILAILAVAVPASAQSLAEIAAKELARRAAIKEPARVITDKDLPAARRTATAPAPVSPDDGKPGASAANPAVRAATETDDNGHDERWWNARAERLLQRLRGATGKLQIASARAGAISAEMTRSGSTAGTAMMRRLQGAAAEVERWTAEVANARRALEELEEEARKAGALPGWLRK